MNPYYAVIIAAFFSVPSMAEGEEITVSTVAELEAALLLAETNGEDDTINLAGGTYTLTDPLVYDSNEEFSITLQTEAGTNAILNGNGWFRCLYIRTRGEGGDIHLRGITFLDGFVSNSSGACLFVWAEVGDISIEDCSILDGWSSSVFGSSQAGGAFIRCESNASILLSKSHFRNNYAKGIGGGAFVLAGFSSTILLVNNTFRENRASSQGGGASISLLSGTLRLINNTFIDNDNHSATGYGGGGIYVRLWADNAAAEITNNIIWGNQSATDVGEDLYVEDDGDTNDTAAVVDLYNNDFSDLDYQDGSALTQGDNIDEDPFLSGDLHLQEGSPCIDKGGDSFLDLPEVDFEGESRSADDAPDMGADEYVPGYLWEEGEEEEESGEEGSGGSPEEGESSADSDLGSDAGGGGGGCSNQGGPGSGFSMLPLALVLSLFVFFTIFRLIARA